jgi:hypothetical protein
MAEWPEGILSNPRSLKRALADLSEKYASSGRQRPPASPSCAAGHGSGSG